MARVPAYFETFLAAIDRGTVIDHVHLGVWDEGVSVGAARARAGFAQAQDRLSEQLVAKLALAPGHRVLDVGCGFGGTLRAIRRSHPTVDVIGLNLDIRQLAVGLRRDGSPRNGAWIAGDACRLPFADAVFDRLLCVEAAFHFPSRRLFFDEARRVLRGEGGLVMSDILLTRPPLPSGTISHFADMLEAEFGPWPAKWESLDDIAGEAKAAGFDIDITDVTALTEPSYHTIAPADRGGLTGGGVLREMTRLGCLHYLYLVLSTT